LPAKGLAVGETRRATLAVDEALIARFADLSGDHNPIHVDRAAAGAFGYPRQVAHGAILMALVSKVIGMELPGPGALWMGQTVQWLHPVFAGDSIELVVTVEALAAGADLVTLGMAAANQRGETVMKGSATVKVTDQVAARPLASAVTRTALVTVASRGIGAAIARRLAAQGIAVGVNYYKSSADADEVVRAIETGGGRAVAIGADVGDAREAPQAVARLARAFGRVDVVVHGASPPVPALGVEQLGYADAERYHRVYVGGALALVGATLPAMIEAGFGRFIVLGTSYMFGAPPPGMGAYVSAKHAVWGLVRSLSVELGRHGITANMVSPGMTVTDLTAEVPLRLKEVEARRNPMRRLATPSDAADVVAFLASDAAGYVNGQNIPVTGGPAGG